MTEKCEVCGKENDDKLTIVVSLVQRLDVCKECMNDYTKHDYDKLIGKLNKKEEG